MDRDDSRALSIGAFAVAVVAMFFAGALLLTRDDGGGSSASAVPLETIEVRLTEMAISPAELRIPEAGARLRVTNAGAAVHSLQIDGLGVDTPEIAPGDTVTVTVGPSPQGTYEMSCTVPGHPEAGMTGLALVGAAEGHGSHEMTWQEMDAVMEAVALEFPAETAGHGGDLLAPTVLADGTKQFDITTKIVQWEVEPGRFVEAWTYNGVVPGPTIKVDVGDKVRVNLTNELPESTTIHFHGVRVPNSMDGVPPYTQDFVPPGGTFVYEFTALEPAVGIYHSHHDAQVQVPNGLFAAFLIGDYEIPDVLNERGYTQIDQTVNMVLNDSGTIGLTLNERASPPPRPTPSRSARS